MRVIITGGAGFLGAVLLAKLRERGRVTVRGTEHQVDEVVLVDRPGAFAGRDVGGSVTFDADIAQPNALGSLFDVPEVSVFHLASIVSAQCEEDFDLAMRVNVDGARNLLETARAHGRTTLVTTSSLAVFGPSSGPVAGDDTAAAPATTYGMTKAILELLVTDYARKGFVDGRVARIPTIIVRPGAPNAAASSAASSVIRESLAGRDYELPISTDTAMALGGVDAVVDGLIDLHDLPADSLGAKRVLTFPSITATFADLISAVRDVSDARLGAISVRPDPTTQAILASWPSALDGSRALALGLRTPATLSEIVSAYRALSTTDLAK